MTADGGEGGGQGDAVDLRAVEESPLSQRGEPFGQHHPRDTVGVHEGGVADGADGVAQQGIGVALQVEVGKGTATDAAQVHRGVDVEVQGASGAGGVDGVDPGVAHQTGGQLGHTGADVQGVDGGQVAEPGQRLHSPRPGIVLVEVDGTVVGPHAGDGGHAGLARQVGSGGGVEGQRAQVAAAKEGGSTHVGHPLADGGTLNLRASLEGTAANGGDRRGQLEVDELLQARAVAEAEGGNALHRIAEHHLLQLRGSGEKSGGMVGVPRFGPILVDGDVVKAGFDMAIDEVLAVEDHMLEVAGVGCVVQPELEHGVERHGEFKGIHIGVPHEGHLPHPLAHHEAVDMAAAEGMCVHACGVGRLGGVFGALFHRRDCVPLHLAQGASAEGLTADGGHPGADGDFLQRGTVHEGSRSDGGERGGQLHRGELGVAIEELVGQVLHLVAKDDVVHFCLAEYLHVIVVVLAFQHKVAGIVVDGVQLVERKSSDANGVEPRGQRDGPQAGAGVESALANGPHAVHRHMGQREAGEEHRVGDGAEIGKVDRSEAVGVVERAIADHLVVRRQGVARCRTAGGIAQQYGVGGIGEQAVRGVIVGVVGVHVDVHQPLGIIEEMVQEGDVLAHLEHLHIRIESIREIVRVAHGLAQRRQEEKRVDKALVHRRGLYGGEVAVDGKVAAVEHGHPHQGGEVLAVEHPVDRGIGAVGSVHLDVFQPFMVAGAVLRGVGVALGVECEGAVGIEGVVEVVANHAVQVLRPPRGTSGIAMVVEDIDPLEGTRSDALHPVGHNDLQVGAVLECHFTDGGDGGWDGIVGECCAIEECTFEDNGYPRKVHLGEIGAETE